MTFEEIRDLVRSAGLRMTAQRSAILAEIVEAEGHISPMDLVRRVRARVPGVNASTVYRTLALLDELGVVRHAHSESGLEYHRAAEPPHAHLTCSSCGRVLTLDESTVRSIESSLARRTGFEPDLTHFAIGGLCSRCRRK